VRLRLEATLPAAPERVWEVASDWERYPEWMPDVSWVRRVGGSPGVGLELDVRTKVLGVPAVTDRMVVWAWEPPRKLGIVHRGMVSGSGLWKLQPQGGGTRFVWLEDIRMPPPVLGELALWAYRPILLLTFTWSMRNLARLVRSDGGDA
jgi:uncharacterized protein YndB with AHSA1/START domain